MKLCSALIFSLLCLHSAAWGGAIYQYTGEWLDGDITFDQSYRNQTLVFDSVWDSPDFPRPTSLVDWSFTHVLTATYGGPSCDPCEWSFTFDALGDIVDWSMAFITGPIIDISSNASGDRVDLTPEDIRDEVAAAMPDAGPGVWRQVQVPEPGALGLMMLALTALLWRVRRCR